jgi:hypothetical protein
VVLTVSGGGSELVIFVRRAAHSHDLRAGSATHGITGLLAGPIIGFWGSAATRIVLAMRGGAALGSKRLRAVQIAGVLLLLIVIWSVVKRFVIDMPNLAAGNLLEDEFDHRYVQPWLAYLHLTPGVLYLLGAPLQLSYRFRSRHYTFHRRLGRVLVVAAMISGSSR